MSSHAKLESLQRIYGGPMTPKEIAVLHDIEGFLDFAIRNGLSFALVIGTLNQDVNNLARYGFDLDQASANGFEPKVTGYSHITPEAVGDLEGSPD
jgi:hypothetical protein